LFDYLILSNGSDIYDVDKEIIKNYKNVNVTNMSNTDQLNSKFWLIINPNGINKLKTLELLCDDLKTIPNKVIFFGDGENDLPIIKGVGLGIAMKNADDITLSNDKEGVANYLEKYLIEKKNSKSDK
jgi:hydroxymethylpyrimidine pyrophosphatase-like HAD family hydrolase